MAHINCSCCDHDTNQTNHQIVSQDYQEFTSKTESVNEVVLF